MNRTENPILTEDQKALFKQHFLTGAPDFEIERFFIICDRTGLDPFSRQIYGNLQKKKIVVQGRDTYVQTIVIITSIDGFRAIAERSGEYRGQTPPEWYYTDCEGKTGWHDVFITARNRDGDPLTLPDACRVGVKRDGFDAPCYGVVSFSSFAKYSKGGDGTYGLDLFWKKMPEHMIAKVAEAQAHRKAFPLLACGLYVEEEVRADHEETAETVTVAKIEDKLPPGASYVETAKAPPAPPVEPPAPPQPQEQQKPPVEAPATKERAKKAKADKPKPEEQPPIEVAATVEPVESPAPQGQAGVSWEDYVISHITIPTIKGKKLGELGPVKIASIYTGWVIKYATNIALNPAKVIEAEMITKAYNATHSA